MLFLVLMAVGIGIQCASMTPLISALLQQDAAHLQAFSAEQLKGLAYWSIDVYMAVFATARLFFATWLFPLGHLVFKSGFLPRILGVLLIIDGVGVPHGPAVRIEPRERILSTGMPGDRAPLRLGPHAVVL